MPDCSEPLLPETSHKSGEKPAAKSCEAADLDWSEALRGLQGNAGLLKLVMETFLEEAPPLQRRIVDAIDRGDAAALKIAAHSLKGAFRYLAIQSGFEHAFRLEKMGEMKNLAEARESLPAIEEHITRVSSAVAEYLKRTK